MGAELALVQLCQAHRLRVTWSKSRDPECLPIKRGGNYSPAYLKGCRERPRGWGAVLRGPQRMADRNVRGWGAVTSVGHCEDGVFGMLTPRATL